MPKQVKKARKVKMTLEDLAGRMDAMERRIDGKIDGLEKRLSGRIDALDDKFEAKLIATENRLTKQIEELATSVADGFQEVDVKIARIARQRGQAVASGM